MTPRTVLQTRPVRLGMYAARRWIRVIGVIALVFGVYLMHGLSGPDMSHDGLPGLGVTSHDMGDMKSSGMTHQHSEGAAMLTMACAYAVLQLSSLTTRSHPAVSGRKATVAPRVPIGPVRGPEPPVPRFV